MIIIHKIKTYRLYWMYFRFSRTHFWKPIIICSVSTKNNRLKNTPELQTFRIYNLSVTRYGLNRDLSNIQFWNFWLDLDLNWISHKLQLNFVRKLFVQHIVTIIFLFLMYSGIKPHDKKIEIYIKKIWSNTLR